MSNNKAHILDLGTRASDEQFQRFEELLEARGIAGEDIPAHSLVFVGNEDDGFEPGKIYLCDKRYLSRVNFYGISENSDILAGNQVVIHFGVVDGFSSLQVGKLLFMGNSGGWTQEYPEENLDFDTENDVMVKIGKAVTSGSVKVFEDAVSGALVHLPQSEYVNNSSNDQDIFLLLGS